MMHDSRKKGLRSNAAMLPAIGVALLPKLVCPACWPAYAGLLGSLGVGFIDYTPYLLPLTIGFLVIALGALIFRAKQRRGYHPFYLGLSASITLLVGKFYFDSDITMYAGLALLVGASLWNSWPKKSLDGTPCLTCAPANL
jgi:hypothetical protein